MNAVETKSYYDYDTLDRVTQVHEALADEHTYFTYDGRGNIIRVDEPGYPMYFSYDDFDRVTQTTYKNSGGAFITEYFSYDGSGRLFGRRAKNQWGFESPSYYAYDASGKIVGVQSSDTLQVSYLQAKSVPVYADPRGNYPIEGNCGLGSYYDQYGGKYDLAANSMGESISGNVVDVVMGGMIRPKYEASPHVSFTPAGKVVLANWGVYPEGTVLCEAKNKPGIRYPDQKDDSMKLNWCCTKWSAPLYKMGDWGDPLECAIGLLSGTAFAKEAKKIANASNADELIEMAIMAIQIKGGPDAIALDLYINKGKVSPETVASETINILEQLMNDMYTNEAQGLAKKQKALEKIGKTHFSSAQKKQLAREISQTHNFKKLAEDQQALAAKFSDALTIGQIVYNYGMFFSARYAFKKALELCMQEKCMDGYFPKEEQYDSFVTRFDGRTYVKAVRPCFKHVCNIGGDLVESEFSMRQHKTKGPG